MLFCIAGQDQRQSAVAGDVAGGAEAVLKGKYGRHRRSAAAARSKDSRDQTRGRHDRTAVRAGCSQGEYARKETEQDLAVPFNEDD